MRTPCCPTRLDYGTALISQLSMRPAETFAFDRPLARPGKGFVVSTVAWPGADELEVDLVSLHLDFLSSRKRSKELRELVTALTARSRRRIVMGDFNAGVGARALAEVAAALDLHTWEPDAGHITYRRSGGASTGCWSRAVSSSRLTACWTTWSRITMPSWPTSRSSLPDRGHSTLPDAADDGEGGPSRLSRV